MTCAAIELALERKREECSRLRGELTHAEERRRQSSDSRECLKLFPYKTV